MKHAPERGSEFMSRHVGTFYLPVAHLHSVVCFSMSVFWLSELLHTLRATLIHSEESLLSVVLGF